MPLTPHACVFFALGVASSPEGSSIEKLCEAQFCMLEACHSSIGSFGVLDDLFLDQGAIKLVEGSTCDASMIHGPGSEAPLDFHKDVLVRKKHTGDTAESLLLYEGSKKRFGLGSIVRSVSIEAATAGVTPFGDLGGEAATMR
jgi:hypothetical protein